MALPAPERGLFMSYAYLWHSERAQGREEGIKTRPCVIVLAVKRNGDTIALERFAYGFVPPGLFQQVLARMDSYAAARRLRIVPRTE